MRDLATRRHERGSAMFVAVLMLVLMGALGIAAMETVTRDRQVAGFQNRSRSAFYAAEAGAAQGRSLVRTVGSRGDLPPLPATNLGGAGLYDRERQLPQYYGDPGFPNPIRYVQDGGIAGGSNLAGKGAKFVNTMWQINVMGQSAASTAFAGPNRGSTARVEVVETKVLASGY